MFVQRQRQLLNACRVLFTAYDLRRSIRMDILIVLAQLRFRRGRVDGSAGKPLALLQARRDADPTDKTFFAVRRPGRAGHVAADDGFDLEDLEFPHLHAAVPVRGSELRGDLRGEIQGEEMGAEAGDGGREDVQPVYGHEAKKGAFVGDAVGEDGVEGADAVCGYEEERFRVDFVEVSHFASGD